MDKVEIKREIKISHYHIACYEPFCRKVHVRLFKLNIQVEPNPSQWNREVELKVYKVNKQSLTVSLFKLREQTTMSALLANS